MTTTLVIVPLSPDDPIALQLYELAWRQAIKRLPEPPKATVGPTTKDEQLALLAALTDFAAGIETELLVATRQAAQFFDISHAGIGRACGISRQAVRQRLAKAQAATDQRQREFPQWDDYDDYYADDDFD